MARKKQSWVQESPEQLPEKLTTFADETLEETATDSEGTDSGITEIDPEEGEPVLPEIYKHVYESMAAGMGIFENIANSKEWLKKNMLTAKLKNGVYEFNGYTANGLPKQFKLIKKK